MVKLNMISLVVTTLVATSAFSLAQDIPIPVPPPQRRPQPSTPIQQQRLQVQQIQSEAEAEIEKLLTPPQQTQYRQARRAGNGMLDSLDTIENLSPAQRTKINTIVRTASERILNLTRRR
jgi:hypothetical protein